MTRPAYPRVPYLGADPGVGAGDLVLSASQRLALLGHPIRVEEKLDGANLSIALDASGAPVVATRGGEGTSDRGGHLGRARAWAAERSDALRDLLRDGRVIYGEWLLTAHGVRYGALPDLFVAFDLLEGSGAWFSVRERDDALDAVGIVRPPMLGDLLTTKIEELDSYLGRSAYGAERAEGVVIRSLAHCADVPRLAKRRAAGVAQVRDDGFGSGRRENTLASVPT